MRKLESLENRQKELEKQKKELEELLKQNQRNLANNKSDIAYAYNAFYINKRNKNFKLYERFPSIDSLEFYLRIISDRFPLYEYGNFNVKELAEIIKHLYQFKRDEEFEILTFGSTENRGEPVYGGQIFSSKSHMFFMIGNDKSLQPFKKLNGQYLNSDKVYTSIYLYGHGKNLVNIDLDRDHRSPLGIECLTESIFDEKGNINYSDDYENVHNTFDGSIYKQIFAYNIRSNLNSSRNSKGIKDVLDFRVHPHDTFIARVLISIAIYKKNNDIKELSEEDYDHIFKELFGQRVDIIGEAKKDIPQRILYVKKQDCPKNI